MNRLDIPVGLKRHGSFQVPRRGKGRLTRALGLVGVLAVAGALGHLRAQNRSLVWGVIAPGGTSTGSVYSISGTVGQPAAASMSGGQFSVQGGYWGVIAVLQTPSAPLLKLTATRTNAVIAWPASASAYILEQNTNLATTNWTAVGQSPAGAGTELRVIVPLPAGNVFYRLRAL
jgi:hypothetical protein